MKITLIREPKGRPRKIDVRDGITVAEICDGLEDIPYTILCAKVDNKLVALDLYCSSEIFPFNVIVFNC